ncbi:hypothetical protein EOJ36_03880 [Sandaracinomonas limnophila]|uniref:Uncharacterized protein n=1 Tax=Sandaracinomonas limnophila TaxID=1862386 RepID=A0A437PTJ0_9BACT|nr:hypothetical protein [Sandaracinomonas limnophila]RVU25566.1 hypothetical protein EOJ36_03880 [Sandaracinomonas limnophila]
MENSSEQKWYQKPNGTIILLVLFFPIGLYQMWKNELWTKQTRWIITAVLAVVVLANAGKNKPQTSYSGSSSTSASNLSAPDICDCVTNAQLINTNNFNSELQRDCENYSQSISKSERTQRVQEAMNRGCLR